MTILDSYTLDHSLKELDISKDILRLILNSGEEIRAKKLITQGNIEVETLTLTPLQGAKLGIMDIDKSGHSALNAY